MAQHPDTHQLLAELNHPEPHPHSGPSRRRRAWAGFVRFWVWLPELLGIRRGALTRAERAELVARLRREIDPPYTITTVSLKGGVGKTTVSAILGWTLAWYRDDRIVAVDANLHAGTLGDRLIRGRPKATVQHLLDDLAEGSAPINSVADLTRYVHYTDRLCVLAGHTDPSIGAAFADDDYSELIHCLTRWWHVVLADCGTGLADTAMRAVLDHTDALILVATPTHDAAKLAHETLNWLARNNYDHLVDNAFVALCHTTNSPDLGTHMDAELRARFLDRTRAVIDIPYDRHLTRGGRIRPTLMRRATRDAALMLAAAVIDAAPQPHTP